MLFVYKSRASKKSVVDLYANKHIFFLGNHMCHLDYLFAIDYVFSTKLVENGPIVFASDHLNKGLLGFLLKNGVGSFISRHSLDQVEKEVISSFINLLAESKIPIIFYPEGGWSAHGGIKMLKLGLLKLSVINSKDSVIAPMKIQFTRTINDDLLKIVREENSWAISKESLWSVVKGIRHFLKHRGFCDINLGAPLFIKKYHNNNEDFDMGSLVRDIKINIELSANLAEEEMLILRLYDNEEIPESNKLRYIKKIFEADTISKKDLKERTFHSKNQFYALYLKMNEKDKFDVYSSIIYENNSLEKAYEKTKNLDEHHFKEIFEIVRYLHL
jgi:1-acyl-sn-glycerol-3-phosphate acyltransferase